MKMPKSKINIFLMTAYWALCMVVRMLVIGIIMAQIEAQRHVPYL